MPTKAQAQTRRLNLLHSLIEGRMTAAIRGRVVVMSGLNKILIWTFGK